MILKFLFLASTSPLECASVSNYLGNIFIWMSNKHHKLNMSKIQIQDFLTQNCSSSNSKFILPIALNKILGFIFDIPFMSHIPYPISYQILSAQLLKGVQR